jgi:hypothetical protein
MSHMYYSHELAYNTKVFFQYSDTLLYNRLAGLTLRRCDELNKLGRHEYHQ